MKRGNSAVAKTTAKRAALAAVVVASIFVTLGCAKKQSATEIVIGTGTNYVPYCYLDDDGTLTGYEVAVLKETDKRLDQYTFRYDTFDFANILVSLAAGKIDVGAHEFEENADRRETYLYGTEGYNQFDGFITVINGGPYSDITSIDDLAGNSAAVLPVSQGSNYEAFAKTWNKNHGADKQLHWEVYGNTDVLVTNMKNGSFAAFITPIPDMQWYNEFIPDFNLKPIGGPVIVSQTYYLYNKKSTDLQAAMDNALRELKADGTLGALKRDIVDAYFNAKNTR
jgi:L-cystine transport system substrate-binding protein